MGKNGDIDGESRHGGGALVDCQPAAGLELSEEASQTGQADELEQAREAQDSEQLGGPQEGAVAGVAGEHTNDGVEGKGGQQVDGEPPAQVPPRHGASVDHEQTRVRVHVGGVEAGDDVEEEVRVDDRVHSPPRWRRAHLEGDAERHCQRAVYNHQADPEVPQHLAGREGGDDGEPPPRASAGLDGASPTRSSRITAVVLFLSSRARSPHVGLLFARLFAVLL